MGKGQDEDRGWRLPMIFMAIGVITAIAWAFWPDFKMACPVKEPISLCFREWMSASAGYVAALFAAGTIILLYGQNVEQKKQTDFLLGDARPTMDVAYDLDDPEQLVIRIVNWNRRGILLIMLDVSGLGEASWGVMEVKLNDRIIEETDEVETKRYLRGWENRNRQPCSMQFKIAASHGRHLIKDWPDSTVVTAGIHIFSERPQRIALTSRLHPETHEFATMQ